MTRLSKVFKLVQAGGACDMTRLSKVFKLAQANLWDGVTYNTKREHICNALAEVKALDSTISSARRIIHHRIHPYQTLEDWLRAQPGKRYITTKRMQAHRLQWLKLLEKEYAKA